MSKIHYLYYDHILICMVLNLYWFFYFCHFSWEDCEGYAERLGCDHAKERGYLCLIYITLYRFDVLLSSTSGPAFNAGRSIWLPGWLNAINENSNSLFLTIGPGDFLVHHAIALGLHSHISKMMMMMMTTYFMCTYCVNEVSPLFQ